MPRPHRERAANRGRHTIRAVRRGSSICGRNRVLTENNPGTRSPPRRTYLPRMNMDPVAPSMRLGTNRNPRRISLQLKCLGQRLLSDLRISGLLGGPFAERAEVPLRSRPSRASAGEGAAKISSPRTELGGRGDGADRPVKRFMLARRLVARDPKGTDRHRRAGRSTLLRLDSVPDQRHRHAARAASGSRKLSPATRMA